MAMVTPNQGRGKKRMVAPRSVMSDLDALAESATSASTKKKHVSALKKFSQWTAGRQSPELLAALVTADTS
jgi:site-specific recombinase XerD